MKRIILLLSFIFGLFVLIEAPPQIQNSNNKNEKIIKPEKVVFSQIVKDYEDGVIQKQMKIHLKTNDKAKINYKDSQIKFRTGISKQTFAQNLVIRCRYLKISSGGVAA